MKGGVDSDVRANMRAAVVVFLVALPLCLGIALASGAPLVSGIIAGIVGGIIVSLFSGSPLGVSGPAAGLAVIVLTASQELGAFEIFLVSVVLAGLLQVILGFARAGIIAYYFPSSVITGMLAGIGIVILAKQIPHALGYDKDPEGDFSFHQLDGETTISEMIVSFDFISPGPIVIAGISLAILILWDTPWLERRKALASVPGPLVAVVAGALSSRVFSSIDHLRLAPDQMVRVPVAKDLSDLAAMFTFPDFSALGNVAVYETAVVIAVVASLETLLCVEATDKLDPLKRITPTNRELKAQGIGNIVSGLLGGLPVTQVIVRSSANIQAGGRSKLSSVIHGVLLVIAVVALPSVMNTIPLATLAAILMVVGYKLAKPSLFRKLFREGPGQFLPFIITVCGIVFSDLLVGIGIGLAAAVVSILIENFRHPFQIYNLPVQGGDGIKIVLAQQVTFLNKASVMQSLANIPDDGTVEIDATASLYIHTDVVEIIQDFVDGAKNRNIDVSVTGLGSVESTRI